MDTLTILGGTFDPIHVGHLYLATQAVQTFGGRVRLIPNGEPPHRSAVLPWHARRHMCELAVAGLDNIEVGGEEPPGQAHYTVATLSGIKNRHPETTLRLIVGEDSYAGFMRWNRPDKILHYAHLLVAARGAAAAPTLRAPPMGRLLHDEAALESGSGGVYHWRCTPPNVSATAVRTALAGGGDVSAMLSPVVAAYIAENEELSRLISALTIGF